MAKNAPKFRVRVLKGHAKNCTAVATVKRGIWSTPWYMPTFGEKHVYRDSIGRRTRNPNWGYRWMEFRCNSTACPAHGVVAVSDIETAIEEATK